MRYGVFLMSYPEGSERRGRVLTVRLPPKIEEALVASAETSGLSKSAIVRIALADLLLAPWRPGDIVEDRPGHGLSIGSGRPANGST